MFHIRLCTQFKPVDNISQNTGMSSFPCNTFEEARTKAMRIINEDPHGLLFCEIIENNKVVEILLDNRKSQK